MSNLLLTIHILTFILAVVIFELLVDPTLFRDDKRFVGKLYLMVGLSIGLITLGIFLRYLVINFINI